MSYEIYTPYSGVVGTLYLIIIIWTQFKKITLDQTKGAIKNGKSSETGNIVYTNQKTQINKTTNTTQYVMNTTMRKQTQIK